MAAHPELGDDPLEPLAPPSLKRLFARHELTLLLLVGISVICGGFAIDQAVRHADFAQRSAALSFAVQAIDADLAAGLRDATHAAAMLDEAGKSRWLRRSAQIDARFAELHDLADDPAIRKVLDRMAGAYAVIDGDVARLFRGAPLNRESLRIKMLGPDYRDAVLARFDTAVDTFLQSIAEVQFAASDRLSRRIGALLLLMPLPLLLALILVWRSRKALEREVLAPVRALSTAAQDLSNDLERAALHARGAAEIVELTGAFNRMQSAMRESREQLRRHERQAALGVLVPVVAHNIRNPLASIRANAQVLDAEVDAAGVAESRQAIMDTVDRLGAWVGSLLTYLGPLRPRKQTLDLAATITAASALLQHLLAQKQLELEQALSGIDEARIEGDPALTEQLVHGLLLNAVEAAPPATRLRVSWQRETACLTIANPGPELGFEPQPLADLTPGPSSKARGTGLGIPFAFKVCEAHGWRLGFSAPEAGWTQACICFMPDLTEPADE